MLPAKELIEELVFQGSPADAIALIRSVIGEMNREGKAMEPRQLVKHEDSAERDPNWTHSPLLTARFEPGETLTPHCCTVEARSLPDGKARLHVLAIRDGWPRLLEVWERIRGEMERDGRIDQPPPDKGAAIGDGQETRQKRRLPHPEVRKRQEEVKRLYEEGRTIYEIAASVDASEATVYRDLAAMGLT